jgi:hypothetical protein
VKNPKMKKGDKNLKSLVLDVEYPKVSLSQVLPLLNPSSDVVESQGANLPSMIPEVPFSQVLPLSNPSSDVVESHRANIPSVNSVCYPNGPANRFAALGHYQGICVSCGRDGKVGGLCHVCVIASRRKELVHCLGCRDMGPRHVKCTHCDGYYYGGAYPGMSVPEIEYPGVSVPDVVESHGPNPPSAHLVYYPNGPVNRIAAMAPNQGICVTCRNHGEVGKWCRVCMIVDDMDLGHCPECNEDGPHNIWCTNCESAYYESNNPKEEKGWCPCCDREGKKWDFCSARGCQDTGHLYM